MSGLDNILAEIAREAEEESAKVISAAKSEAEALLSAAEAEMAEWEQNYEELTRQECEKIYDRAAASDRQERRQAMLSTRNRVIEEILAEAKARVQTLPDKDYFDLLFRLYQRNAQPGNGEIYFAKADYSRIPADFIGRCEAAKDGCNVTLGGETGQIQRGFFLRYGKIEQNCSIEGIFEAEELHLRDKVHAMLPNTK